MQKNRKQQKVSLFSKHFLLRNFQKENGYWSCTVSSQDRELFESCCNVFFCANGNSCFFVISSIVQKSIFMNFLYNEVGGNPVIFQRFLNLCTVPTKLSEPIIVCVVQAFWFKFKWIFWYVIIYFQPSCLSAIITSKSYSTFKLFSVYTCT